jgi:hypothetical protein
MRLTLPSMEATVNNLGKCANQGCSFGFPTVPTGHRVVVQHITAEVSLTGAPINVGVEFQGAISGFLGGFSPPVGTQSQTFLFDQPVLFYLDSPESVAIVVNLDGSVSFQGAFAVQVITLTGYELDCTVAVCAPIATQ